MAFRVIICGTRDFRDIELLCKKCDYLLQNKDDVEVVSGGARGADRLGEIYAESRGFKVKVFDADWERDGKSAGHIRNTIMANYAEACIAFWDGKSPGTADMLKQATDNRLQIRTIPYQ